MVYKVPFVDAPKHYKTLKEEILTTVDEVLSKGNLILRDELRIFENNIASLVGTKYAVGVNSGFDALHLSVKAASIGPEDEVITVAHTFVATVAAIVHCGGTPVLVDVGEDFNMDVEKLNRAITSKTKAIIPVHLNGRLCDMEKLMSIAEKYNLVVIEDAAQALGAKFSGKMAGCFGLTGCFSFYPFKILGAFGDGGVVVTNNPEIARKISFLRDHGQDRSTGDVRCYGFNCRLDNLQAAILNVKLKYLSKWIKRRREVAAMYQKGLSDIPSLKLPHFTNQDHYFDVYQNYVIRAQKRDKLVAYLKENSVEVLISWPKPMHHYRALRLRHFDLPETERISKEVVSLPINAEISDGQVEYVVDCVRNFYGQK